MVSLSLATAWKSVFWVSSGEQEGWQCVPGRLLNDRPWVYLRLIQKSQETTSFRQYLAKE